MAGVERREAGAQLLGAATLMRLAGVLRLGAPDDAGLPRLLPEALELHPLFIDAGGVSRVACQRPGAGGRIEIREQPVGGVLPGRSAGQPARYRGSCRTRDDVADLVSV